MEKILIYIKHHLSVIWRLIDWFNGFIFAILFRTNLDKVLSDVFKETENNNLIFRKLNPEDGENLYNLIASQPLEDIKYFRPHAFDLGSINALLKKPAFLMMGVFEGDMLIGYFFLRFFANKKSFVGRLIDKNYRGNGIGEVMNHIMYETSWRLGFRCLSTISKKNKAVMGAHAKNNCMQIIKELQNEYLLVEFVKK